MSQSNTIADFIIQSWAKIAMTPKEENSVIETKMDIVWNNIAQKNPTEFAKQGVAMAAKDIGRDINPYGGVSDNELDKLIEEEVATLTAIISEANGQTTKPLT